MYLLYSHSQYITYMSEKVFVLQFENHFENIEKGISIRNDNTEALCQAVVYLFVYLINSLTYHL